MRLIKAFGIQDPLQKIKTENVLGINIYVKKKKKEQLKSL